MPKQSWNKQKIQPKCASLSSTPDCAPLSTHFTSAIPSTGAMKQPGARAEWLSNEEQKKYTLTLHHQLTSD